MPEQEKAFRSLEPVDRLTRLCAEMSEVLEVDANSDVKAIIALHDDDDGGLVFVGYESDEEAIVDMVIHLKAIVEANGKSLIVGGLPSHLNDQINDPIVLGPRDE